MKNSHKNHIYIDSMPPAPKGSVIGLYGGSFNPVHDGHIYVANIALKRLNLDQVWWLVTPGNPLKDQTHLRPLPERVENIAKLTKNPKMKITGFEQKIQSHITIDSLHYILAKNQGVKFIWIMGADSLAHFHHWQQWQNIAKIINIAVIDRPTAKMSALSSKMAQTFQAYRINEANCAALAFKNPPAWTYIHGKKNKSASSTLRKKK